MRRLRLGFVLLGMFLVAAPTTGVGHASTSDEVRCRGRVATIVGTNGDDTITVYGFESWGGPGNDHVSVMSTGTTDESVHVGIDWFEAGPGDDRLDGGAGVDSLDGGDGTDACIDGEHLTNCES